MPILIKNTTKLNQKFPDEQSCRDFIEFIRWRNKPVCPRCKSQDTWKYDDRITIKCAKCKRQFNVKTGTVFADSRISLKQWFLAFVYVGTQKGVTAAFLARELEITRASAWYLKQKIMKMIKSKTYKPLMDGIIEVDEVYITVEAKKPGVSYKRGRGSERQARFFGMLERGADIRIFHVENTERATLEPIIRANVKKGAAIMSDEWGAYNKLNKWYNHNVVVHGDKEYAREGGIHVNTLEGAWSHLKRKIRGIHQFMTRKYVDRYCAEFSFWYNNRKNSTHTRFFNLLSLIEQEVTYKDVRNAA